MALNQSALEAVRVEFHAFLEELRSVEKKVIHALTEVARDILKTRPQGAGIVATVIIERVLQAPVHLKLPTLYLLDSIVKLVGEPYVSLFAARLPQAFAQTWQAGNLNLQKSLQKLYSTWSGVFSQQVLVDIAAGIAQPHVQPALVQTTTSVAAEPMPVMAMQAHRHGPIPSIGMLVQQQLLSSEASPNAAVLPQQPAALQAVPRLQQQQLNSSSQHMQPSVNMADLMASLVSSGVLAVPQQSTSIYPCKDDAAASIFGSSAATPPQAETLPSVEFSPKHIKEKKPAALQRLLVNTEQTKGRFLDRKFVRRQRKTGALCISRLWYVDLDTWMASTIGGETLQADVQEQDATAGPADPQNCSVPVDDSQTTCALSGERFEQFWDEQQQEWHYKNTIRLSDDDAVRYGLQAGALVLISALSTTAGNLLHSSAGILSDLRGEQDICTDIAAATNERGENLCQESNEATAAARVRVKHEREEKNTTVSNQAIDQKRLRVH